MNREMDTDEFHCSSPHIQEVANETVSNILPAKSANIYEKAYQQFLQWCLENDIKTYNESVLISYFKRKATEVKASTLWSTYSMLKSTLLSKHNVHMKTYFKLIAFIKQQNASYTPKKSNVFTREEFINFLLNAPDAKYLMWKVCFLFGVAGACRMEELKKMMIDDINDTGNVLLVTKPDTKPGKRRTFTITDDMADNLNPIEIYRKYRELRPFHITHKSFFLSYKDLQCSVQPLGIHAFGKIPSEIAKYLKLPYPSLYTGHAFRRTSASLLADTGSDVLTLKQRGRWNIPERYLESSTAREEASPRILRGHDVTPPRLKVTSTSTNDITDEVFKDIKDEPNLISIDDHEFDPENAQDSHQTYQSEELEDGLSTQGIAQPLAEVKDQYTAFGEHVGLVIRDLQSPHARTVVKHLISNLLYDAELGKYDELGGRDPLA